MKNKKISRRAFLKGAAAGAAGIGALGMGAAGAVEQDAAYLPASWDYEADVVIVGYGVAGGAAAREAIAEGVSCIILEKCDEFYAGGSGCASAGNMFGNPKDQLLASARGYVSSETVDIIWDEGARIHQWVKAKGLDMSRYGATMYHSFKSAVDSCGVHVLYETPGKRLIFDPETHEVFGVCAEDRDGNEVYVKANKGVLLATGCFLGNEELVHRFLIPKEVKLANVGAPTCTGDGLLMGLSVNAALKNMTWQCLENYGQGSVAFKKASDELGSGLFHSSSSEHRGARIYVNQKGQRFMNEDKWYIHSKGNNPCLDFGGLWLAYEGFVNLPMYLIFDSQLFDAGSTGLYNPTLGWAMAKNLYDWSPDNKAELEKSWIVKGDTIEELIANLAEQSGNDPIDAEALKATIETFNGYCAEGLDAEFGRDNSPGPFGLDPSSLEAIGKPPYYACEIVPSAIYTIGGLHWGEGGETLDWDGNPIPGLYHAGDVGQFTEVGVVGLRDNMGVASYTCRNICSRESRSIPGEAAVVIPAPTPEEMAAADITGYTAE